MAQAENAMTDINISSFITDETEIPQIVGVSGKAFTVSELRVLLADMQEKIVEQKKELENFQTDPIDQVELENLRDLKYALEVALDLREPKDTQKENPEG